MVAVSIPIMGTQAVALFTPGHVYSNVQDACGEYPKHFPTPSEIIHPEPPVSVGKFVSDAINDVRDNNAAVARQIYKGFLKEHWNVERNHLKVEYLEEGMKLFREMIVAEQNARKKSDDITASAQTAKEPVAQKPQQIEQKQQKTEQKTKKTTQLSFNF